MSNFNISIYDIEAQFLDFMRANNCEPECSFSLKMDGQIHRFRLVGDKHGDKNGAYCLFNEGWPAGWCQNWREGPAVTWHFSRDGLRDDMKQSLTDEKYQELLEISKRHQEKLKAEHEEQTKIAKDRARILCEQLPELSKSASHPYLNGKQFYSYGLKINRENNNIAVPIQDINGNIVNIQWISPDGDKWFMPNAPVSANFFPIKLDKADKNDQEVILVGEGVATMSTVYELTKRPCVAALNCGNIKKVVEALRTKYPNNPIVIMADNDHLKPKNAGKEAAEAVCRELNLDGVVMPDFTDDEDGTDWNDFFALHDYSTGFCHNVIQRKFNQLPVFNPCLKYKAEAERLGLMKAEVFADFIKPLQGANFLIEDWIPTESMMMMFAPSGSGKGFVAVDLAYAIANPDIEYWQGKKIYKHGPVIYLAGEGQKGLRKRFAGIANYYKEQALENDDEDFEPVTKTKIAIIKEAISLNDPNPDMGINKVIANIGRFTAEPALVIIDTTNRYMAGDENKTSDATSFIQAATKLMNQFHCSVLIIHHTGLSPETQGRARGSSVIKAAVDMEFRISKNDKFITLEMTKSKDTGTQKPLVFEMKQVDVPGFFTDSGSRDNTCVLIHNKQVSEAVSKDKQKCEKMSKTEKLARETYKEAAAEFGKFVQDENSARTVVGVPVEKWREIYYRRSAADNQGTLRSQFKRAREALLENKKILFKQVIDGEEYYCLSKTDEEYENSIVNIVKNRDEH